MTGTEFFHCKLCDVECRIDFESDPHGFGRYPLLDVRHCPQGEEIFIAGKITGFKERRGGIWVDVQGWIAAA